MKEILPAYRRTLSATISENLREGDILSCALPTDYKGTGDVEMKPRYAILLGFDVNPDTHEVRGLIIAKLAKQTNKYNPDTDYQIPAGKYNIDCAFNNDKSLTVKTSKLESIPPYLIYFGQHIEKAGDIDYRQLDPIKQAFTAGQSDKYRKNSEISEIKPNSLIVPNLGYYEQDSTKRLCGSLNWSDDLDDYELALIQHKNTVMTDSINGVGSEAYAGHWAGIELKI